VPPGLPATGEPELAEQWRTSGVPEAYQSLGAGGGGGDLARRPGPRYWWQQPQRPVWTDLLAVGLAAAATEAVSEAGDLRPRGSGELPADSPWERARGWFVSSYPLLGALAAGFRIVADVELARSWQISVAAVDAGAAESYVNPLRTLPEQECRFVLAHEMLHAALRHGERIAYRDPYLWNVACDFVINGWLVEMGVGTMPADVLYDPLLKGLSSEAVYDRIAGDLRRFRKLATLRGRGLGDMLAPGTPGAGEARRAADLDDFYRRALVGGLAYHDSADRGLLPSGLIDEIRVLDHPPPPWDVQLARWFDEHFPTVERRRSYARASRRQSATPDIPRPGWAYPEEVVSRRTFGVVLDTSGSMDGRLLGKALGAIASYATARDVPAARVVFCDAAAYDAGYLPVTEIAGRVKVRGRGGTVLQPGIRLLERAEDFPDEGPILVITDGYCDVVRVRREHAFLVPAAARLPFTPRGPVFRLG
jgi:predicted metal-dependent peptidase